MVELEGKIKRGLTPVYHSVLNVKVLAGPFNQEKALLGVFSDWAECAMCREHAGA